MWITQHGLPSFRSGYPARICIIGEGKDYRTERMMRDPHRASQRQWEPTPEAVPCWQESL
jgi:hypothetical protein